MSSARPAGGLVRRRICLYIAVGVASFLLYNALYLAGSALVPSHPNVMNAVSYLVVIPLNFLAQRYLVFRSGARREIWTVLKFLGTTAALWVFNQVVFFGAYNVAGIADWLAVVISAIVVAVASSTLNSVFVFRRSQGRRDGRDVRTRSPRGKSGTGAGFTGNAPRDSVAEGGPARAIRMVSPRGGARSRDGA